MKTAIIIITLTLPLGSIRAQSYRDDLRRELLEQAVEDASQTTYPVLYQTAPVIPDAIYQAYPNNPQLYRFLERNPRYISWYLGGQIGQ